MKKTILTSLFALLFVIQIDVTTSSTHLFSIKDSSINYPICDVRKTQTKSYHNGLTSNIKNIAQVRIENNQKNSTITKILHSLFPSPAILHISRYNNYITQIIKIHLHQDDITQHLTHLVFKTPISPSDNEEASLINC